jgi:hypothetical protein
MAGAMSQSAGGSAEYARAKMICAMPSRLCCRAQSADRARTLLKTFQKLVNVADSAGEYANQCVSRRIGVF